jgi:hypothetical protein
MGAGVVVFESSDEKNVLKGAGSDPAPFGVLKDRE